MADTGEDGRANIMLTRLYLDRLGARDRFLRLIGMLSTIIIIRRVVGTAAYGKC